MTPEEQKAAQGFTWIFAAGVFAGLGALLASKETLTLRVIAGRAISSAMLGIGAAWLAGLLPAKSTGAITGSPWAWMESMRGWIAGGLFVLIAG